MIEHKVSEARLREWKSLGILLNQKIFLGRDYTQLGNVDRIEFLLNPFLLSIHFKMLQLLKGPRNYINLIWYDR